MAFGSFSKLNSKPSSKLEKPSDILEDHLSTTLSYEKASVEDKQKIYRKLENRHVQLIAIGGSIGTGLFVTIGQGLVKGGPLGLFLAYTFWTCNILLLTTAVGEMVCYLPIAAPFVELAGRCVDEAFECCVGWNFYLMEALYIPFEITAVNGMIHFWRDDYSPAITVCLQIFIYSMINLFAVRVYGESEFWLSLGKLILCLGLLVFTFIAMVGGNPQHDVFGFRNWNVAGGPVGEYITTGALGKFEGFLNALLQALFTVCGPEYMSMVAAEARNPRKVMPIAFKTVLYRLAFFYVGGALSVSILIAYNDPTFVKLSADTSNAASSPYVVAMQNLHIQVLPHIVNALVLSAALSAGNSYMYCSTRTLYSLANRGFAPKFFRKCTKQGVPIYAVFAAICFSMLSLMQLGSSSATALSYMVSLVTGAQIINYAFMTVTYLGFFRACKAQELDRRSFPYRSWFQPYSIYISATLLWIMVGIQGYYVFIPGHWKVTTFLFSYLMVFVDLAIFLTWKLVKRTKFVKAEEADLTSGLKEIEDHEYEYYAELEAEGKNIGETPWWRKALQWIF